MTESRHSALSELMIQNSELREQLRLLQSAYDSLSQIKEKQVASRIETDELRAENAEIKSENARLKSIIEKARAFPASIGAMDSIALVGVLSILEGAENE